MGVGVSHLPWNQVFPAREATEEAKGKSLKETTEAPDGGLLPKQMLSGRQDPIQTLPEFCCSSGKTEAILRDVSTAGSAKMV